MVSAVEPIEPNGVFTNELNGVIGVHSDRRSSFGKTMIVDAWGTVGQSFLFYSFIVNCSYDPMIFDDVL